MSTSTKKLAASAKAVVAKKMTTSNHVEGGISDADLQRLMTEASFRPTTDYAQMTSELEEAGTALPDDDGRRFGLVADTREFGIQHRRIDGTDYRVLVFHAVRQDGCSRNQLRPDQCLALTKMLLKMWNIEWKGVRNLVRKDNGFACNHILMPPMADSTSTNEEQRRHSFKYLLSTAWLLRRLKGDDLVAYGAEPWQPNIYDIQRHKQFLLETAARKGDAKARLTLLQQKMKKLEQERQGLVQDRRHLRADERQLDRDELALIRKAAELRAKIAKEKRRVV